MLQPTPTLNELDTAAATGNIVALATLAGVGANPVVAYAIEFEASPTAWFEVAPKESYFGAEPARVRSRVLGANTGVSATIPMIDTVYFIPNMVEVQVLHVWVGRSGTMSVDPANGVTGAELHSTYRVHTSLPAWTVVPDRRSVEGGIDRPGAVTVSLFRAAALDYDETYTVTLAGNARVLETLSGPSTVTILAKRHEAALEWIFDPTATQEWPRSAAQVGVTFTSASGSVTSNLNFSGAQLLGEFDFEPGCCEVEPTANKDCIPSSVLGPQPTIPEKCGKCVKLSVTPECPPDSPGSSGSYLWYYPYQCPSGESTCTVTSHTGTYAGTDCSQYNKNCKPDGGLLAHLFPATVGSQVAKHGHQCCFTCTPSTVLHSYTFPTCQ
ncbi:MAG: hypothetical protein L6Q99_06430 [Planctomycetes bacterium]|nr:hypothetical protein [Planctomycetota bacterium]